VVLVVVEVSAASDATEGGEAAARGRRAPADALDVAVAARVVWAVVVVVVVVDDTRNRTKQGDSGREHGRFIMTMLTASATTMITMLAPFADDDRLFGPDCHHRHVPYDEVLLLPIRAGCSAAAGGAASVRVWPSVDSCGKPNFERPERYGCHSSAHNASERQSGAIWPTFLL
jgi:hypothetical protein